jgi:hypothetical protein
LVSTAVFAVFNSAAPYAFLDSLHPRRVDLMSLSGENGEDYFLVFPRKYSARVLPLLRKELPARGWTSEKSQSEEMGVEVEFSGPSKDQSIESVKYYSYAGFFDTMQNTNSPDMIHYEHNEGECAVAIRREKSGAEVLVDQVRGWFSRPVLPGR